MISPYALSKVLTALLLVSDASVPAPQASEAPPEYVRFGQEVVLRVSGDPIFFVTSLSRGMDALDARSGNRLWHSNLAKAPLLTRNGQLLVVAPETMPAGGWALVLLDAETGALEEQLPSLPADVVMGETPSSWGSITTRSFGDRDVVLWRSERLPPGAPIPPTSAKRPPVVVTDGALTVDLKTRTLTPASDPFPGPRVRHTRQFNNDTTFEIVPFDVDGLHVQILPRKEALAPDSAIMRRTRNGTALPDVVMGAHWSAGAPPVPSVDYRHVAQLTRNEFDYGLYNVEVVAVATGVRVGYPFMVDDPPAEFVVLGNRFYYRSYLSKGKHDATADHVGVRRLDSPTKPIFVRPIKELR